MIGISINHLINVVNTFKSRDSKLFNPPWISLKEKKKFILFQRLLEEYELGFLKSKHASSS